MRKCSVPPLFMDSTLVAKNEHQPLSVLYLFLNAKDHNSVLVVHFRRLRVVQCYKYKAM